MNRDEHFLSNVVDRAVVHSEAPHRAPNESKRFLINLVERGAHDRRTGFRQGEMSNLISWGKWDSEGQTAAFIKAAAPELEGLDASLDGCPSILDSIKPIPVTPGFSNCRETSYPRLG